MVMAEATQRQAGSSGYWLWVYDSGYLPSDQRNGPHQGTQLCNSHYMGNYCYSNKQPGFFFLFLLYIPF